jgi:hypothetical protein
MPFKSLFAPPALAPVLETKLAGLERTLDGIARRHSAATLASTLSDADMVITHVILRRSLNISIVAFEPDAVDAEALDLIKTVRDKYQYVIEVVTTGSPEGCDALVSTAQRAQQPVRQALVTPGVSRFELLADWTDEEAGEYLSAFKVPRRKAPGAEPGNAPWQNLSGVTAWVL